MTTATIATMSTQMMMSTIQSEMLRCWLICLFHGISSTLVFGATDGETLALVMLYSSLRFPRDQKMLVSDTRFEIQLAMIRKAKLMTVLNRPMAVP